MAYLGKTYTLDRQEKFDEFLASLGVPKAQIEAMNSTDHKSTYTLSKNGDTYSLAAHNNNVTFKSGVEFEDARGKFKSTYVVDGNTVTNTQRFPEGKVLTFKNVYDGDKLTVTATSSAWDGTAYRYYSA